MRRSWLLPLSLPVALPSTNAFVKTVVPFLRRLG
jgi:hypothetical protein